MAEELLRFNITKEYSGFHLNCEALFYSGVTGIFGPSGSGKTTLLNCISGFDIPDKGFVSLSGVPMYSSDEGLNIPPEKRNFGYVAQDTPLFPHLSVLDNILFGYKLTDSGSRKIDPKNLIDLFNLASLTGRSSKNLSGGERQRVALARALATSPRLLLLDEPFSSIDVGMRGVTIRYLKSVWRELKTPMVLVSHSISEVLSLAEDVLILRDGKKVLHASATKAFTHPSAGHISELQSFENIVDGTIVENNRIGKIGLSQIQVGSARILVPKLPKVIQGKTITISIRAGDIILALDNPTRISAQNIIPGLVQEVNYVGCRIFVYIDIGIRLIAEITQSGLEGLGLKQGMKIFVIIKSSSILILDTGDQS